MNSKKSGKPAKNIPKKHEVSIEDAAIEALEERPFLQGTELVEAVEKKTEYKVAAIRKRLGEIKNKTIVPIDADDLKHYGIIKTDGRAKYFTLADTKKVNDHINKVIGFLKGRSQSDIKSAINELELYESRYILDQNQLDALVDKLDSKDNETVYKLLRIIFTHVYSYGIYPSDDILFLKKIKELLKKNKMEQSKNLHVILVWILGLYEDESLIDYLKWDLKNFISAQFTNYELAYKQSITAKVIEAHRSELFDFQRELEKDSKKEEALLLSQIRAKAAYDISLKRKDEAMKMPDEAHIVYKSVIP
jgi:hypothetical protein